MNTLKLSLFMLLALKSTAAFCQVGICDSITFELPCAPNPRPKWNCSQESGGLLVNPGCIKYFHFPECPDPSTWCSGNSSEYALLNIADVPYVTYGANRMFQGKHDSLYELRMDLFFLSNYLCENDTSHDIPFILMLPPGVNDIEGRAQEMAARGFMVGVVHYRKGRPRCGHVSNAEYEDGGSKEMFRAVQDIRIAARTMGAIADGYYSYQGINLKLPFIDKTKMMLSGTSFGAVLTQTTAYYDACDLAATFNCRGALDSVYPHCPAVSLACPNNSCNPNFNHFELDISPDDDSTDNNPCMVRFYFDASKEQYRNSYLKGIVSQSGGSLPYPPNLFCSVYNCDTCSAYEDDPNVIPPAPYAANTDSDKIPAIFFGGTGDPSDLYLHTFQSHDYETNTDGHWAFNINQKGSDDNIPIPFTWGSKEIFLGITSRGVRSQLFGFPFYDHSLAISDLEGNPIDIVPLGFTATQTTKFFNSVLCDRNPVTYTDELVAGITNKLYVRFKGRPTIKFNCSAILVEVHYALTNVHKQSVNPTVVASFLSHLRITDHTTGALILDDSVGHNYNYLEQKYKMIPGVQDYYFNSSKQFLIQPGKSLGQIVDWFPLTTQLDSEKQYDITFSLTTPNGAVYSFPVDPFTDGDRSYGNYRKFFIKQKITTSCQSLPRSEIQLTEDRNIEVYPNPSEEHFNLILPERNCLITISDELGRIREILTAQEDVINIGSDYRPGIYFITLTDSQGNRYFGKAIKQ